MSVAYGACAGISLPDDFKIYDQTSNTLKEKLRLKEIKLYTNFMQIESQVDQKKSINNPH